jgi:tetraacyldisaccharide 4'-kinase
VSSVKAVLGPLGRLYGMGAVARRAAYHRGWLRRRRLGRPVVSVGNLAAGGTGKTPLVYWLCERLQGAGLRPAILTRGYGRRRGPDAVVVPPKQGRQPEPRDVGDEAAWLARALPEVPVGVSADRFRTGRLIEDNFPVDVFVLDDGFQHLALVRELDVVTLDATRPISDGAILPAGLQREPCSALARADVVVITRTELAAPAPLEAVVRRMNPEVTLIRTRTRLDHVVDVASGASRSVSQPAAAWAGRPVHAFCGIGNPEAFFRDLRLWGFDVVRESVFLDHHVYRDLRFAHGGEASALVTTEKDAMNLEGLDLAAAGVPVLACCTRFELVNEAAFDEILFGRLGPGRVPAGGAHVRPE